MISEKIKFKLDMIHEHCIVLVESGRRWCAHGAHKCCCCGIKSKPRNAFIVALCCITCFPCSLSDACCSVCRKNINCGPTTICRRRSVVIIGLFIRIFVRETIAAVGPLLVVIFEEEVAYQVGPSVDKAVVIILAIIAASLVAYVIGALIGVWIEAVFRWSATRCCVRSTDVYRHGNRESATEYGLRNA